MNISLTNTDITNALGVDDSYIVKYSDLTKYETLEDLFQEREFMAILIEEAKRSGHWVVMVKKNGIYLYNNSYGFKPDEDLDIIGRIKNKILGNTRNSIKHLQENSDAKLIYNKVLMQGKTSSVCGRYVITFVRCILNEDMNMSQFQDYMLQQKKFYGFYDKAVLALTS